MNDLLTSLELYSGKKIFQDCNPILWSNCSTKQHCLSAFPSMVCFLWQTELVTSNSTEPQRSLGGPRSQGKYLRSTHVVFWSVNCLQQKAAILVSSYNRNPAFIVPPQYLSRNFTKVRRRNTVLTLSSKGNLHYDGCPFFSLQFLIHLLMASNEQELCLYLKPMVNE